ncbi:MULTISPECIES: TIGR00282 family metallophosphoesterase [unclassified Meiothermus]|uniref:TIGR00282 family metallophosphoesterase n=1 Tax=unclassified Meiothermus TaxID=370471 RepID=UPI000D7B9415|nr:MULTISPECIES: TIGR00282 family metallophosphoesterase [unclassified Meiothermus]PZA06643.1 metallophosphoesterase [Meiothermus sp. Pnk-1]RYM30250.1 YmdB family metallophosphoesterase [Meiothermus sp. PNK-Is4]
MRVLFIGDVFAEPGLRAVALHLPDIRNRYDFVIANAENSAGGKGLSRAAYKRLREAGVDLLTLGNHAWDHKDVFELIETEPIIRAINYPPGTPGKGHWLLEDSGQSLLVAQVMGRVFLEDLDDPFRGMDRLLQEVSAHYSLVEVHAEATSEKMALGFYLDGRVSAVLGTHTHIPTSDAGFLPRGTAYQTDVGMTGTYRSIIGGEVESFLARFLTARPQRFKAAEGQACFHATELVLEGGRVIAISPYRWEEPL